MSAQILSFFASGFFLFVILSLNACRPLGLTENRTSPGLLLSDRPGLLAQSRSQHTSWGDFVRSQYQDVFTSHDTNQDGLLNPEEIPHVTLAHFKTQDRNQDGKLSFDEVNTSQALQQTENYLQQEFNAMSESLKHPESGVDSLPSISEIAQFTQELENAEHSYKQLDRPPVLLVPGYAEPSWYFLYGLYRQLKKEGWQVEGINLFPNFATAEEQASKIQARVMDMKARYGVDRVELVVHSFGGIISRYYIQNLGGEAHVRNLVTIATPHHGTYTAYLGPGKSADQMRYNSPFIQALNAKGYAYAPVKYTSIWSNIDEIVIPPRSAVMPESTVYQVPWTGHLGILFSKRTYNHVLNTLSP